MNCVKVEEWFSTTLSSIGDGVIVTDQYCRVIFMNPVARQLTKWGHDGYGKLIETVFDIVHERTRAVMENPIRKALRDGRVVEVANHTHLIRKDKSEIAISDSAAPIIDDQGQITGVVLVFRDVTEQKKTEAAVKYNALLLRICPMPCSPSTKNTAL
jgi:PAS domain S-box-containing protein